MAADEAAPKPGGREVQPLHAGQELRRETEQLGAALHAAEVEGAERDPTRGGVRVRDKERRRRDGAAELEGPQLRRADDDGAQLVAAP